MRWLACLLVLVVVWTFPSLASAQNDRAAAEALFKEARKAMKAKDYASACPKLEESYRLDRAPGTLLNLADCEEKLGKLASAWQRFDELVQTSKKSDKRYEIAARRAKELDAILPRLTLRWTDDAPHPNVKLELDGVALGIGSLGVALPIDPGSHSVVVNASGREPKKYDFEVAKAEKRELVLELGAPVVEATADTAPTRVERKRTTTPKRTRSKPPVVGYVIGGVGVLGILTSGVAGVIVLGKKGTVNDECSGDFCSAKGVDAADAGKTWSTVATVSFIGGAVLTGVGAYLVLSHSREKSTAVRVGPSELLVEQTF